MSISFDKDSGIFHLQAGDMSYVMKLAWGDILHLYWGAALTNPDVSHFIRLAIRAFSPDSHPGELGISYDFLPLEYPFYGTGDFRQPAFQVRTADGHRLAEPKYVAHHIAPGKSALPGLPCTYVEDEDEAQTLSIELYDPLIKLRVTLVYSAYTTFNAITRAVRFTNEDTSSIQLLRTFSCNVDFQGADFNLLQLSGSWARERHIHSRPLCPGTQSIESRRGASSHQHNPFIALTSHDCTETQGEAYGFALVYSGSFLASVEVDQFSTTRVGLGINPFDFTWNLAPGETFQTPEAVLVHSDRGLTGMSHTFHELFRKRLCRGTFRDRPRPVLINNWEATYFNFNEDKLLEIAQEAKELGIELFVLDDGWFGKRNEDNCSLGDWVVNTDKLPSGLSGLAHKIRDLGLEFGLWFEPEMVSPDSELYRAHPDWCLHVAGRRRTEARNQLVLDLSRADVCDYLTRTLSTILASAPISYVKWDMNRSLTEIGSALAPPERQGETAHRHILGLYRILDELTRAFPHILFESCSGGGGRFDSGMLAYMPQIWTSDDTDAVERLKIQHGTSLIYPPITIGAHVSAVPNHQVHRTTPLLTRLHASMAFNLGFELDVTALAPAEKNLIKAQIALYKEIRPTVQFGRFYRLLHPGLSAAWLFVSEDKTKAVLLYFKVLAEAHEPFRTLRLTGLAPEKTYTLVGLGQAYNGDTLMHAGFTLPVCIGDYGSSMVRIEAT